MSAAAETIPEETQAAPAAMTATVRMLLTLCVMLASLMQTLDSTIANVALPYMQGSMSASQEEINWVLTSYLVAAAIMTTPTGFLAGRFGVTRMFVLAITGFTLASVACGMATSLDQIVLFRAMQGVFGAGLVPLSQSVMFDLYPVEQRNTAMTVWATGVMIGPVLGPILGGWLTENDSWRWVFYINVPFGLFAAAGLLLFLKEKPRNARRRLDWIGFAALSLAIGALQAVLDRGETLDWFGSHEIILEACLAGLGLYIFLVQFWLSPAPFLSPALFRDVNFVTGVVLISVNGMNMYATLALLSPYLQLLMNYPVVATGVILAPRGAGIMIASMLCGRLLGRIGAKRIVAFGILVGIFSLYEIGTWSPDVSETTILVVGFIQGLSIGLLSIPLNITTFATLPLEVRTEAAGIFSLMRNLGSAIGISVTGAVLATTTQMNHAILAAQITPFNRMLQSGAVAQSWNPRSIAGAMNLDAVVTRQANIIGYGDDFKLLLMLSVVSLPLAFLLRPAPQTKLE